MATDQAALGELGLEPAGETGHNEVFAVNCPPFASLYLGEGHFGVDGAPDHLTGLLDRYAALGEAGEDGARLVLFGGLLWSWLPAYLGAVRDLPAGPLTGWAELTLDTLRRERERDWDPAGEPLPLPRALREAPPAAGAEGLIDGLVDGLVDGLLTPLRSGMILTRRAVLAGAEQVGAGQRTGNRRRALAAMLAAEPDGATRWLAGQADHWARRHEAMGPDLVQMWWAERAAGTARLLRGTSAQTAGGGRGAPGGGREAECVSAAD